MEAASEASTPYLALGEASVVAQKRALSRWVMLAGSLGVLFTRYCIATMLTSFFAEYCDKEQIGESMNGLIMSAYPIGVMLGSVFAAFFVTRFGTRLCVAVGMTLTAVFTLALGLTPDALGSAKSPTTLAVCFFATYFLSGLTGAISETACITLCGVRFPDKVGSVMAAVGTSCGVGCMAGPPLGGLLYGSVSGDWQFRLPFVVFSGLAMLLVLASFFILPEASCIP